MEQKNRKDKALKPTTRSKLTRLIVRREKDWRIKDLPPEEQLEHFMYYFYIFVFFELFFIEPFFYVLVFLQKDLNFWHLKLFRSFQKNLPKLTTRLFEWFKRTEFQQLANSGTIIVMKRNG